MDLHTGEGFSSHINEGRESELLFWARLMDASPDEVRRAIRAAGPEIRAVRQFLGARQLKLDLGVPSVAN